MPRISNSYNDKYRIQNILENIIPSLQLPSILYEAQERIVSRSQQLLSNCSETGVFSISQSKARGSGQDELLRDI